MKSETKNLMTALSTFLILFAACGGEKDVFREGGGGKSFKIPLPKGYDWEVSQSWESHCEKCDEKYPFDSEPYCKSSHVDDCCEFGWDFNLPGKADSGKPVLATANGIVERVQTGENNGWGNTVILNHGNNICSRYSHLLNGSIVVAGGEEVCQGMQLAEIGDTGHSFGSHLHFQFEDCKTSKSLKMGFNDGNGIPICVRGSDRYNARGDYIALKLTNTMIESCDDYDYFGGGEMSGNGWKKASCGALDGCPLISNCGRGQKHRFTDDASMGARISKAANYLYGECAVDGDNGGAFLANRAITRAEALKIPMHLFGLMGNCGSGEPFVDVNSGDWFFGVVTCAVGKGIVDPATSFKPNSNATFAEAAKFVVMAASKASVIKIQNPSSGHFPKIGKDHWAYKYAETLYYYGGLASSPDSYSPEQVMDRGAYALMVASMSPCFCENISCQGGCACNQEMFACVDGSSDPGIGGEEGGSAWANMLDVRCSVDPANTDCVDSEAVLYIKCGITNNGDSDLLVNDLVMKLKQGSFGCEITDSTLQSGVGVQRVVAGETRSMNGHYEISCPAPVSRGTLEVSLDLKERITGQVTWYYGVAGASISLDPAILPNCGGVVEGGGGDPPPPPNCVPVSCFDAGRNCGEFIDNKCAVPQNCGTCTLPLVCSGGLCRPCEEASCWQNWRCDPQKPYRVSVSSFGGGSVEILTASGARNQAALTQNTNYSAHITLNCGDLPAAVLAKGGPGGVNVDVSPITSPPSEFYYRYGGTITTNPGIPPTDIGTSAGINDPNSAILVRVPFRY